MQLLKTIKEVRDAVAAARRQGKIIGLVPTMGALHAGHGSLIQKARADCSFVVVSIFVNPTQFGPTEDFNKYPRTLDTDTRLCESLGVDCIFAPLAEEMYPQRNLTWVDVEQMTKGLCGASRPGHFQGVATVCAKLFHIVQPDRVYFGQKDAQQAAVICRMVTDLNFPMEIIVCPTVRERDGLAMSSRNRYLSSEQRKQAVCLYQALCGCRKMVEQGIISTSQLIAQINQVITTAGVQVEYISIVDAQTLQPMTSLTADALVALACRVGTTRLIDNMLIFLNPPRFQI
ncbi:MAG: pantoate--beta-alanine ligase [Planctomycetes bacterium]|nr:pantoate--beta-alanine ligase [Planctomycetota bacterium]